MKHKNDLQFERWATRDNQKHRNNAFDRSILCISIRFYSVFSSVSNLLVYSVESAKTFILTERHMHMSGITLMPLDSNEFDKIFKFAWASAWHSIRISFQTALTPSLSRSLSPPISLYVFHFWFAFNQLEEKIASALIYTHKFDPQSDLRV